MNIIEGLTNFGLTRQEATIYVLLLKNGQLTGYEAAKQTGISRSNTYTALAGLVDKGAAYMVEEDKVTRYTPVSVDEFCSNKIRRLYAIKAEIENQVPQASGDPEGYITIRGEEEIINKLKNTITEAQFRIYLSAGSKVLALLRPELEKSLARRLKVVIIGEKGAKIPGSVYYSVKKSPGQIRLIADSHTVITGDIDNGEDSTCLYSCKRNLVDLFKDAVKNEIELLKLKER